ncbi:olfactory receptor 51G2-like [Eublepharis macularius]|uniref:Olfactory receptor 51G2-like n=1 Tax=Eublepharis macularius TaxID=481883 RepID=A0AA97KT07_EUBMA|nr:olfactory receptor 51G2-like [Eublepharis macularius]
MSLHNSTRFKPSVVWLTGIPGMETSHIWISIPFFAMYLVSVLGNATILFIIKTDRSLHEPMYAFLSMLAVTDLGLSISTMPTILGIFWFNAREISLNACFTQLFFIHSLSFIESSVLLAMAFDRVVAIRSPLRYASILTMPRIRKMGLTFVLRGMALIFPLPFLLRRHRYCRANVLFHSYCLHQEVMKLACSDITVNSIYGMFVIVATVGVDSVLILLSYTIILKTVLSIASWEERLRALNTCVSHICAVLLFYMPMIGLSVIHRFGKSSPLLVRVFMGYVYLMVPPLMNPVVYSVKTKQIRARIIQIFSKGRTHF